MRKVEGYRSHRDALDSSQLVCLAKFDFARRKGTTQVAEWALDLAATEVETTPDKLSLNTVLRVAKVCLEYGTSLLARNDECRQNAVDWLRRSVKLLERIEGGTLPQIRETQAQALRKLARAFYQRSLSLQASDPDRNSYLDLADATITELQRVYRTFAPSLEYDQRLVLLRLNILGLRQAPCRQMLDLIDVLCSHTDGLSHDAVGCVLALLRSRPAAENDFIGKVLEELLRKVLADQPEEVETIEKIVLTILTLCKNSAMLGTTRSLLEQMDTAHFRASRDGSFAAQMLLWKYADAHLQLQSPDRMTAATLFQLAAHPIFSAADRNAAKSIRRASLCYLEAGETALANEVLLSCPSSAADDALNHHLRFNVFAKLGQEDHAMAAFNALLGAPNFRSSLLPSIVETAQKAGLEKVLYQALRDIADRAQGDASLAGEIDLVVLTRSLIKQCLSDDKMQRIDAVAAESLLQHFTNNLGALRDAAMKDSQDKKACQEAQWSYKTAYNTAIAMSSRVDPDLSAKFFDLALSLAKVREELIAEPVEVPSFQTIKVWAKLPAIVARSMIVREQKKIPQDPEQRVLWFKIKDETMEGFKLVEDAQKAAQSNDLLKEVVWSLVLLQYEAIVNLQDWTAASQCFHDHVAHGKLPVAILEAMADLTWGDPTAPDELLTGLLKANIDAARSRLADPPSSKSSQPDLPRLARWTRALISYTLTNKTMSGSTVAGDGRLSLSLRGAYMEALTHIEDTVRLLGDAEKIAASVLREYPSDEMSWLIATAWDTGVELYKWVLACVLLLLTKWS